MCDFGQVPDFILASLSLARMWAFERYSRREDSHGLIVCVTGVNGGSGLSLVSVSAAILRPGKN